MLLIELYGIEITGAEYVLINEALLIELYGIEMQLPERCPLSLWAFNRTIWNWNFEDDSLALYFQYLLIELYGIEIEKHQQAVRIPYLLIELYGIEIRILKRTGKSDMLLLIELYGIEIQATSHTRAYTHTFNRTIWNWNIPKSLCNTKITLLLIELYGIEMWSDPPCTPFRGLTFNRTIWNWNFAVTCAEVGLHPAFNRTIWNWNWLLMRKG